MHVCDVHVLECAAVLVSSSGKYASILQTIKTRNTADEGSGISHQVPRIVVPHWSRRVLLGSCAIHNDTFGT